jgi:hypothetical protein
LAIVLAWLSTYLYFKEGKKWKKDYIFSWFF